MKKIVNIKGQCIPLFMDDVDTDLIIPAQYLTSVSKHGFGRHVFQRLRDSNPDFAFNQPQYKGANILIAHKNFGCGSSREHAVWALKQAGIEAVIAVSFADIFFNNAAKNGLVLIKQPENIISQWLKIATEHHFVLEIALEEETLITPEASYSFDIAPFTKHCFINGLDELDYILSHQENIKQFFEKRRDLNFIDMP